MTLDEVIRDYEHIEAAVKGLHQESAFSYISQMVKWLKELKLYQEDMHSCQFCEHQQKASNELPCAECKHNHEDKFEWHGSNEFFNFDSPMVKGENDNED